MTDQPPPPKPRPSRRTADAPTPAPAASVPAPIEPTPLPVRCGVCRYGRDVSLGPTNRRCRRNPPLPHYQSKPIGHSAGTYAIAMWPIVGDQDYCGEGEVYVPPPVEDGAA